VLTLGTGHLMWAQWCT